MAVNKNFVVKNGLEVNENLIVANATDSFVGVGTSTPNNTLHVFGGIGATDVRITGFSSFIQSVFVGASGTTFAVIDTPGSNPQVGIGTDIPAYLLDIRSAVSTGQTALYVQGDARITGDLIADDITLDQANFTNINVTGFTTTSELVVGSGASVTGITTLGHLNRASAGSGGTSITFNPAAGISTNLQIIGNTYIEGDLKIQSDLEVDADLFIVGIITAGTIHVGSAFSSAGISTFMSDVYIGGKVQTGLEIAGVTTTASSGGITTTGGDLYVGNNLFIKDDITVDTNLNILGIATIGILTVTTDANVGSSLTVGGNVEIGGTINSLGGITTTGGDLYVGNNLFIKDDITVDTNLNILGVATVGVLSARDAVVSGASTVNGNVTIGGTTAGIGSVYLPDNSRLSFGTDVGDLIVQHDGSKSSIINNTGYLNINSDLLFLGNRANDETYILAQQNGSVDLFFNDTKRFETSNTGAVVTGILTATGIGSFGSSVNVVGAQFVGGNLTVGGDLNVTGDITYDEVVGRNLDITGIATIHTLGVTSTTTTTDLSVGAAATVGGVLKVSDTTDSTTKDTGAVIIEGGVGIEKNLNLGTTIKMDATSGIITATTFSGVGEVLGIGSEGTPIGSGVSFVDFRSTNGAGVSCQPAVNGIATVTFTPGVSLGLAIALGG